jgi:hypothetical protein
MNFICSPLKEMPHEWDINIVAGLNKFFMKFLHKDRTLAMTVENKVRIYLAVLIDSVGYTDVYQHLPEKNRAYLLLYSKLTGSTF